MPRNPGVGVIVRRGAQVLLGRREKAGEPVSWSVPGGTLEDGESFEQAAVREPAWFDADALPEVLFGPIRFVLDRWAGRPSGASRAAYSLEAR